METPDELWKELEAQENARNTPIFSDQEFADLIHRFLRARPEGATEEEIEQFVAYAELVQVEKTFLALLEENLITMSIGANGERRFFRL